MSSLRSCGVGRLRALLLLPVFALLVYAPGVAAERSTAYSPAVAEDFPRRVYFGDTHSHSNNSPDAFSFGNRSQTPELAYRYARGEALTATNGMPVRIRRAMDFLVVSDHAEYLGVFPRLVDEDASIIATELGSRWFGFMQAGEHGRLMTDFVSSLSSDDPPRLPGAVRSNIWTEITRITDRHNDPGVFTTFNAYEWTSMPDGNNLHRVVIFRDSADKAGKVIPFSALDSDDPEDLWQFLADYEQQHGGRVMSIAHNGNLSNGMMFSPKTLSGAPLSAEYARRRMRWEPLYEVTQVKGDGEAHPQLSPADPYADYETWDEDNVSHTTAKEPWMLKYEYARSALKLGLAQQAELGVNPFQFGLIGSTDIHTGFADPDESNFFGKFPDSEPSAERSGSNMGGVLWPNWRLVASGYAAIWAHENTRDSLFEAMQRRETYATTGTRITVRMFGGWDFEEADVWRSDFARRGYARGVPMGSELRLPAGAVKRGLAPRFMLAAARDPESANLERIQVVKGWFDAAGELHEQVYDVAVAEAEGTATRAGSLADVSDSYPAAPHYSLAQGSPYLATVWRDPDFDAAESAFYYVRVIEVPTPRWTAYDADYFGVKLAPEVPPTTRERAYTSPIWYCPPAKAGGG